MIRRGRTDALPEHNVGLHDRHQVVEADVTREPDVTDSVGDVLAGPPLCAQ
ncbi:hypothetical protein AB0K02_12660 [Streptomyces sp. NPDC049597]|uniref:hypothetical protein n=1 Tax=Streptomyces sp. NPDC049597 TaxID=3155276 RepID=UPI00342B3E0E